MTTLFTVTITISYYGLMTTMGERHLLTARRAAQLIKDELNKGDLDFAYRTLMQSLAHFRSAVSNTEVEDFLIAPASTGDSKWDTFLAAATGRECELLGLRRPQWTDPKPLKEEWHPGPPIMTEGFRKLIERDTSQFMKKYGFLIRDRDFTTL